ncbi:hypothetical protein ACIHFD_10955 [Nonomuraea sp. NPDC051941]|uniref:hypothetical protein n=1 Tax=Nonomuraea sp. NPDC051941 TaxID=3364373 RepID=UPI0037C5B955
MAVWTDQQLAAFLTGVAQDRLYAAWWPAALRGLRRSELAGLRWTDVDLQAAELTVTQQRVHADGKRSGTKSGPGARMTRDTSEPFSATGTAGASLSSNATARTGRTISESFPQRRCH